jgi:hypothetical protein
MMRKLKIIYLLLPLIFCSCGWKDAKEVIATAERMDMTEHVVYDDTAAIAGVIRKKGSLSIYTILFCFIKTK